ncbi:MAG: glycosyltransferase [Gemmatimonadaceae bacterium]|nr:glycosyltransferase [Gemmatimonadaceae bacterium]
MLNLLYLFAALSAAAIAAIWVGYPLAVWLAARRRRTNATQPSHADAVSTHVTVVIATRDDTDAVTRRLRNVFDTDYPAELLSVVVALDASGSQADPTALAAIDERVAVASGDDPGGKAATLNAGVRSARGDILVLADVAQDFDRETIPALVAALADPRFGAVSGALSLATAPAGARSPVHLYWEYEKWLRWNESRVHSSIGVTGAVYAVRRALWPVLPAHTLLDDVFVPMHVAARGHRIGFTYDARAHDRRVFSAVSEGTRKVRTQTGVMQLLQLLPELRTSSHPLRWRFFFHKTARLYTPYLLLPVMLAAVVAFVQSALRAPVLVLSVVFVGAVITTAVPPLRRLCVSALVWGYTMQRSTARALQNGVRGEWAVWNKKP